MLRATVSLLVLVTSAIVASKASAESSPRLQLRWEAPAACPPQEAITAAVEGMVAQISSAAPPLQAKVQVFQRDGRFSAHIAIPDGSRERARTISGDTCPSVSSAIAVVLALAIDPTASGLPPEVTFESSPESDVHAPASSSTETPLVSSPQTASKPATEVTPAADSIQAPQTAKLIPAIETSRGNQPLKAAVAAPDSTSVSPEESRSAVASFTRRNTKRARQNPWLPEVYARFGGAAEVGVLPGIAPRLTAGLELSWGAPRLLALVDLGLSADAVGEGGDWGGHVSHRSGRFLGCGMLQEIWRGEVGGCLGFELGEIAAEGYGILRPRLGTSQRLAFGAGIQARGALTDEVAVNLTLFGFVSPKRSSFFVEGRGDVYRTAPVGGRLGIDLSYLF